MEAYEIDLECYYRKQKSGEEQHQAMMEDLEMLLDETLEELQSIMEKVASDYEFVTYSDIKKIVLDKIKKDL